MERTIDFYNSEVERFNSTNQTDFDQSAVKEFVNKDPKRISWDRPEIQGVSRNRRVTYSAASIVRGVYRPFQKQWTYFDRHFNNCVYQMPRIFPHGNSQNLAISITGLGESKEFTALITDLLPNLHFVAGGQCFPLYLYDKPEVTAPDDLFSSGPATTIPTRRDAITDAGLAHFQAAYPAPGEGDTITKEDLFYYIYGLLHSPDYRSRYADNLGKELPRIPAVKAYTDFRAFSQAGRDLAHWHLNYETVAIHPGAVIDSGKTPLASLRPEDYRVVKMKFAKTRAPETNKSVADKTTVIYNERLTIRHIPLEAYDYVVNGKPALEWVMERQSVTTDKASNITNDANLWATETMGNAKYPLELFLRVITVSLETMKIVRGLPGLEIA
jgi:predicted helicase